MENRDEIGGDHAKSNKVEEEKTNTRLFHSYVVNRPKKEIVNVQWKQHLGLWQQNWGYQGKWVEWLEKDSKLW